MGNQQVTTISDGVQSIPGATATPNYSQPLAIVTTLIFMWGFLTCLNDILVPHLKSIFDLSYARAMLIQFAFFSAYFLFSVPWSKIVNAIGYKTTMVVSLLTMAVGAFLFVPAASVVSYPLFLTALLVLAAGITGLQVSANPYVVLLGKPETASSRLDLTQAFNSLGTTIAPNHAKGKCMSSEKTVVAIAAQPTTLNPLDIVPDEMPFDVPYGAPVSLDRAQVAINAAVAEAKRRHWKINVAVVDSGRNLVAFERMDGVRLSSIQIAERKARAAATFRRETKFFENGIHLSTLAR
jgi:hypothetical protein